MYEDFPIEKIDYKQLDKVIFTSDLLRVDDREKDAIPNPQRMNVDWVHNLIWPKLERFALAAGLSFKAEKQLGDEGYWQSLRVKFYQQNALEMSTNSWAGLYVAENYYPAIRKSVQGLFENALIIGYEMPPYLLRFFNEEKIPYVDLHVHPVRFLPDYMFGIRTNVKTIAGVLHAARLPESFMYEHADILRAKSARMFDQEIQKNSVLFLGQLSTDASLIAGGRMMGYQDVEANLINLCMRHEHVYYKKHPHLVGKAEKRIRKLVDSIRNCHWLEANVYDAFGAENFSLVASLSSGGLVEAEYFGKQTEKLLDIPEYLATDVTITPLSYLPVYEHALRNRFWEDVLKGEMSDPANYRYQYQGELLKTSLNIVWGK